MERLNTKEELLEVCRKGPFLVTGAPHSGTKSACQFLNDAGLDVVMEARAKTPDGLSVIGSWSDGSWLPEKKFIGNESSWTKSLVATSIPTEVSVIFLVRDPAKCIRSSVIDVFACNRVGYDVYWSDQFPAIDKMREKSYQEFYSSDSALLDVTYLWKFWFECVSRAISRADYVLYLSDLEKDSSFPVVGSTGQSKLQKKIDWNNSWRASLDVFYKSICRL